MMPTERIAQSDRLGNFLRERLFWSVFLALTAQLALTSAFAATPKIQITVLLESNEGSVFCALHDKEKAFPSEAKKAVATSKVKPKGKKALCTFENVAPGTYAVAAYHDSNDNGELDTNWIGIPKEGTAATNDAKGRMGPPKFEDAKFVLPAKGFEQKITMSY